MPFDRQSKTGPGEEGDGDSHKEEGGDARPSDDCDVTQTSTCIDMFGWIVRLKKKMCLGLVGFDGSDPTR